MGLRAVPIAQASRPVPTEPAAKLPPPSPLLTGDRAETFSAMGLPRQVIDVLAESGITIPTPIQALAIPDALLGRDVCGKAKTGSGKTLAFGIPMLMSIPNGGPGSPSALVLVPTRELAAQVTKAFAPIAAIRGLRISAVYGGTPLNPQMQRLRSRIDVIIATPGRMNDLLERGAISVASLSAVVIDEADQMADLGFMPQVERILNRVESKHQTFLFSATLDGDVDKLVRKYQDSPVFHDAVEPEEDLPAMKHRFIGVSAADKVDVAVAIASGPERTLFFVRTQRAADRLAMQFERERLPAGRIHGRLSQAQRDRAMRDFASGALPVLVATNIAARGIHVDGVDTVVHFDPPDDPKTYLHRSGRTARAGASGVVVTLVTADELHGVNLIRKQAGIREGVVSMDSSDARLAALADWEPPLEEPELALAWGSQTAAGGARGFRGGAGGRAWSPRPNRGSGQRSFSRGR